MYRAISYALCTCEDQSAPPPSNREDWVQSRLLNGVFHQLGMQEVGNKLVKRHKVSLKQDNVWRAVSHLGDNSW